MSIVSMNIATPLGKKLFTSWEVAHELNKEQILVWSTQLHFKHEANLAHSPEKDFFFVFQKGPPAMRLGGSTSKLETTTWS